MTTDNQKIDKLGQPISGKEYREAITTPDGLSPEMKAEMYRPAISGPIYQQLARFAATDESRPVLAQIALTPHSAMAADGFRLAVIRGGTEFLPDFEPFTEGGKTVLVPAKWINGVMSSAIKKARRLRVLMSESRGSVRVEAIQPHPSGLELESIGADVFRCDGTFPDAEQIIPPVPPVEELGDDQAHICFNARYLRDACDLAIALWKDRSYQQPQIILRQASAKNRDSQGFCGAAVRLDVQGDESMPSATIVIMPMVREGVDLTAIGL